MARLRFLLAGFLLAQLFLLQATAARSGPSNPNPPQTVIRTGHYSHSPADKPSSGGERESSVEAEAPEVRQVPKHHSSDRSVAGGGVIIGGLVTAIFATVYCYIRVTRKREGDDRTLAGTQK